MSDTEWTSKDDNRAMVSEAMQHVMVNLVTDGDDDIARLRGFDLMYDQMRRMGVRVDLSATWLNQRPDSRTGPFFTWMRCPGDSVLIDIIIAMLKGYEGKTGLCVAVDLTFPWRHPESITWATGERPAADVVADVVVQTERILAAADIVTTSYEQLVPEIAELNPNVLHIPDTSDDIEGWEIGVTALFAMAMKKCGQKR